MGSNCLDRSGAPGTSTVSPERLEPSASAPIRAGLARRATTASTMTTANLGRSVRRPRSSALRTGRAASRALRGTSARTTSTAIQPSWSVRAERRSARSVTTTSSIAPAARSAKSLAPPSPAPAKPRRPQARRAPTTRTARTTASAGSARRSARREPNDGRLVSPAPFGDRAG